MLHNGYTVDGGLKAYISKARVLLESSKLGKNPFDGWVPEVPEGVTLGEPYSENYMRLEKIGLGEIGSVGFVLGK